MFAMSGGWQFLDRPAEQDAIRSALVDAGVGGIVLVGPEGVGKTTLARAAADSSPIPVRWVACTESSRHTPLGVFAHLIDTNAVGNPAAQIASARRALVGNGEIILGVDDAHLLDPLSATLLHNLALDRAARIVATVRSNEPAPNAVVSLWKDGHLRFVELQPLNRVQTTGLVESVVGGKLEELSAASIWDASGGNLLFLKHFIGDALEAGRLREVAGIWQLRGDASVSSGLASLLESRFDEVGEPAMGVLNLLALCEPLDLDVLLALAGAEAIDDAENSGLIRITEDSRPTVQISHPQYAEVIRRRLGKATASKLRGRIADVLSRRDLDSAIRRLQLAQLYVDSNHDAEPTLLVRAAQDALSMVDVPLAERLARRLVEQTQNMVPGNPALLLTAQLLLFRAVMVQGRRAEAEAIVDQMKPEDPDDQVQLVLFWGAPMMGIRYFGMGDVDGAHELLDKLRQRVTDPTLIAILDAYEAGFAVQEGRVEEGLLAAEAVLSNPTSPPQALESAAFAAGQAMPLVGRGNDFRPISALIRSRSADTGTMAGILARYTDVLALVLLGEFDQADQQASAYAEFCKPSQFLGWAITKAMDALVASYRGRFPDAVSACEQALAALQAENTLPWDLPVRLLLTRAHAALGRPDEAQQAFAEAAKHMGAHMAIYGPQMTIARSWIAAARGANGAAIRLAHNAADEARQSGQYMIEAEALHHAARFGGRSVADRLSWLAERVDGRVAAMYARHAAALAGRDGVALDLVSLEFEESGMLLSAADTSAQAASHHDGARPRQRRLESAERAFRLAAECGSITTPATRAAARPLPLTSREREIAALIGEGLTNRQVAERLSVSVRTVEGHIYRACTKLDLSNREELGAIVR